MHIDGQEAGNTEPANMGEGEGKRGARVGERDHEQAIQNEDPGQQSVPVALEIVARVNSGNVGIVHDHHAAKPSMVPSSMQPYVKVGFSILRMSHPTNVMIGTSIRQSRQWKPSPNQPI